MKQNNILKTPDDIQAVGMQWKAQLFCSRSNIRENKMEGAKYSPLLFKKYL